MWQNDNIESMYLMTLFALLALLALFLASIPREIGALDRTLCSFTPSLTANLLYNYLQFETEDKKFININDIM